MADCSGDPQRYEDRLGHINIVEHRSAQFDGLFEPQCEDGLMPIYEYACTACGERTEARQSFDDPPLDECPVCGGKLRKLYSPVGIVFKGSGFYSTDSGKGKKEDTQTKADKKEKKPEKKTEAPSTTTDKSSK